MSNPITPYSYTPTFKSGDFHHVVLSISGTTHTLYLDGSIVKTNTSAPNIFDTFTTVNQTIIGANAAFNQSFRGIIGDVRVYNQEITATQVSNLYMNRNLIAHYPFDTSVNSLTPNYATLQYDATIKNSPVFTTGYIGTSALQLANSKGVSASQYIVTTPNNFYLNSTTGLTISCWVNFDSTNNVNNIMRIFDIPLFPNVKGLGVDICGTNVIVSSRGIPSGLIGVMDKLSANTLNSLINPKSVSTNAGACAFALKLLYSNYTNPVISVRKYTGPETDFYADLTGNKLGTGYLATGTSFDVWLGSDTSANVMKWYDQTGNNNTATAVSVNSKYPSLSNITANIVYNNNANTNTTAPSGYYIFFDQCYFTLPNGAFPYETSRATYITKTYISSLRDTNQSTGPYHSNYPAGGSNAAIFSTNSQSANNYYCGMLNLNKGLALFSIGNNNSFNNANISLTPPMLNTSIAFSYNNNTQLMYVNGSNVGTFTYNINNINTPSNNPAIGWHNTQAKAPGCFYFFYAIPLDLSLNNTDRDLLEKTI